MTQPAEIDRFFHFIGAGPDAADLRAPVRDSASVHVATVTDCRTVGCLVARVANAPPGGVCSGGRRSV
jgi:hypothetical protein